MAVWMTPVVNRTQADVDYALSKLSEWKNNTYGDIEELKGCLNVSDINRIENNIQYLSDKLSEYYYFPHAVTKRWTESDLPDITDISRIIGNVEKIIEAFHQHTLAPDVPDSMVNFEQINSIEKNIALIRVVLTTMVNNFKQCGTFECGE